MMTSQTYSTVENIRRDRAIGAMFYAVFGGVWISFWNMRAMQGNAFIQLLIVACMLTILTAAYRIHRSTAASVEAAVDAALKQKIKRQFWVINVAQWIAIFVVGNVLTNLGLSVWFVPAIMLIVGLHFIPLARTFRNSSHYFTGFALILLALDYPLILQGGPANTLGCLGAGLILWTSALWALSRKVSKWS